ncbi:MAG: hypothetical protein ACYTBS_23425 [Planctomycetota bacterium]|jgi:hypothetical protein
MHERNLPNVGKSEDIVFGSNSVRPSGWEWIVVAIICLAAFCFAPSFWGQLGEIKSGPDYRLPYALGSDYWSYKRLCRKACSQYEIVLVGDSVVWGHYVPADGTLAHYLNENAGQDQFANLGADGSHPAALWGLIRYYGQGISNKKVILHLNPLWMSDKKQDLQTDKEYRFNHPRLVPQFRPKIPCYKESWSERMSVAIGRRLPFLGWTSHLRTAYFESMDVPAWTLEHPYANPVGAITLELPVAEQDNPQDYRSWTERSMGQRDLQWVELETSLQWKLFRRTVELFKERDNEVFVLVGPFNEHMLTGDSPALYDQIKSGIENWLRQNSIPHFTPEALPSEQYADASHPLAEGYALLAKQLFENGSFRSSILGKR